MKSKVTCPGPGSRRLLLSNSPARGERRLAVDVASIRRSRICLGPATFAPNKIRTGHPSMVQTHVPFDFVAVGRRLAWRRRQRGECHDIVEQELGHGEGKTSDETEKGYQER